VADKAGYACVRRRLPHPQQPVLRPAEYQRSAADESQHRVCKGASDEWSALAYGLWRMRKCITISRH